VIENNTSAKWSEKVSSVLKNAAFANNQSKAMMELTMVNAKAKWSTVIMLYKVSVEAFQSLIHKPMLNNNPITTRAKNGFLILNKPAIKDNTPNDDNNTSSFI
jgi:hypothetical protein